MNYKALLTKLKLNKMSKINTLKGILKMKVQRLQRELELLSKYGIEHREHWVIDKVIKLETEISTLKEVIDIIDTL